MYQKDLTQYSQDVAYKFASAFICRLRILRQQIKSSIKEQSATVDDSHGEASAPALVMKAGPVASHRPKRRRPLLT